jgi:DNA-binding response OmpR family regulator
MDARIDTAAPARDEPSAATACRIVVIDDDPDLLACTSLHLRCAGSEVIAFTDAARALSELDTIHADAVVTDWQMPYIDGADVVRDIRRRPYAADLPVIVYSAAMTPGAAAQMHALGADASVSKLDPPGELVDTVMRLLARRPAHPTAPATR